MEPALAVVVPIFDEAESIEALHREIDAALASLGESLEIVLVDDGSRDGTAGILRALARKDARVRVVTLDANHGQSAALDAGFRVVRAPVVATLDADLQNDPADIPRLLGWLGDDVDVVNGVRVGRKDSWTKILSSRIANRVRNALTGESVTDVGCSLRVMRSAYLRRIKLYRGMHRFLPTLLQIEGARIVEVPVSHRARRFGTSKYGLWKRLFEGSRDLLAVRWMKQRALRYRARSDT
jgi:glycosyltransferase involved in cell wall biosynthesis